MDIEMQKYIKELADRLVELRELHEQLLLASRNKQRTMRSGDLNGVESWTARENFLAQRIQEVDALRRTTNEQLGTLLGFREPPSLHVLAEKLDEPDRSRLLALAGAIRATAEQIHKINQVNDAVTREILNCFAQVRQKMASSHNDIELYDTRGQKKAATNFNILDAVG
jgi:flagellar biosynthesis/type III secretory pathway chaperone